MHLWKNRRVVCNIICDYPRAEVYKTKRQIKGKMQVGVLQGSKFYKFAIRETSYCIVTFSLSYGTEKLINAERADNKIKNTETLLGCIKYSM